MNYGIRACVSVTLESCPVWLQETCESQANLQWKDSTFHTRPKPGPNISFQIHC